MRNTRIAAAVGAVVVVGGVLAAASVIPPGNDGPRLPAGQRTVVHAASSDPNVMYHSGPNILADSSSPPVMYHS
jgi:hypothetical protein